MSFLFLCLFSVLNFLCLCVSVLSIYFCLLSPSPSPSFSFLSLHSNTHGLSERCAILGALLDSCIGGRRLGCREERPSPYLPPWPYCPLSSAQSDRGEYRTEDGLVKGHAYSVTGTHKVSAPCQVGCQECPGATLTGDATFRCPWASPKCGCCGCGTPGAAWSGPGPGVTGGMDGSWLGGGAHPHPPTPHTPVSLAAHAGMHSPPSGEMPCW